MILVIAILFVVCLGCSYNAFTLQILFIETKRSYPGSHFWKKTLQMKQKLHIMIRKRNIFIIESIVTAAIAFVLLIIK